MPLTLRERAASDPTPDRRGGDALPRPQKTNQNSKAPSSGAPAMTAAATQTAATADAQRTDGRAGRDPGAGRAGRRGDLRLSGRCRAAALRRAVPAGQGAPHPGPPRAGGGARGRGLCPLDRQGRRGPGHLRPRCHQHRHRPHRRADGLGADRLPDRPGADAHDRQRRLPGGRHGRHHPALHQAQLPGEGGRATSPA